MASDSDPITTMKIHKSTLAKIARASKYRRETYEDVILRLLEEQKEKK